MRYIAFVIVSLSLAALAAGCGQSGPAPDKGLEFSAVLVSEEGGGKTENRISFRPDMQRVDMMEPGSGTIIIRMDKGVSWTLMPAMRLYLEVPVAPQNKNPLVYCPDKVLRWEKLGEETVEGHPAIKERLLFRNKGGDEMEIYRWFATDIRWPIKAQAIDGKWGLYYRDIRPGKQDPSLFELPQGYRCLAGRKRANMH
jgi:hypothetical protein